jgi:hypothetical protein
VLFKTVVEAAEAVDEMFNAAFGASGGKVFQMTVKIMLLTFTVLKCRLTTIVAEKVTLRPKDLRRRTKTTVKTTGRRWYVTGMCTPSIH